MKSLVIKNQRTLMVVLPMRAGSQRVPQKNTKPFSGYQYGLAELKLKQLLNIEGVSEILIDTDEPSISKLVDGLGLSASDAGRVRVEVREPNYAGSDVTTDSLIRYLGGKLTTTDVLWTHVTSPFINSIVYEAAIEQYYQRDQSMNDSLMSVTRLQEFIWDESGPCNYDYKQEKWPRTQTLPKWYFVNSGMFMCPSSYYLDKGNRIGETPVLFELDKIVGFDVDWPIDFEMAEHIASTRPEMIAID